MRSAWDKRSQVKGTSVLGVLLAHLNLSALKRVCVCVCLCVSVHTWYHARFLWNFPSRNTGVGCHFLLEGIFLTQGLNPSLFCLLHWQVNRSPLRASLVAQTVKNLPAMRETWVWSLGWEDPLEKGKATHSSTFDWRIPWTEAHYSPWVCRVGLSWTN